MTIATSWSLGLLGTYLLVAVYLVAPSDAQDPGHGPGAASFLLAAPTDRLLNQSSQIDATISSLLSRYGPDMRVTSGYRDEPDLSLEVAQRAWRLLQEHALSAINDRVLLLRPTVEQLLIEANVSVACKRASSKVMDGAQRLEWWATQLLTSWGSFPPTGLFEGTYGDIGSYNGCINVPENEAIGHAHYCSISYRPLVPRRRDFELVLRKEPDELINVLRAKGHGAKLEPEDSALSELIRHSQYNHFIYYKLGACFPIGCSPLDVQRLARLLGRRSILMTGPVRCQSKFADDYKLDVDSSQRKLQLSAKDVNSGIFIWRPHVTQSQWVALAVVVSVVCLILAATLVDLCLYRLPPVYAEISRNFTSSHEVTADLSQSRSPSPKKFVCPEVDPNNNDNQNNNNNNNLILSDLSCPKEQLKLEQQDDGRRDSLDGFRTIPLNETRDLREKIARIDDHKAKGDKLEGKGKRSLLRQLIEDCSVITNFSQFMEFDNEVQVNSGDISCINGIRSITMSWIIITHTMQYNDWSAFARIWEIETHLSSLINQPLFNGSYLVDTFFLVSGLLTSYSSFRPKRGAARGSKEFSTRSYLIGRYLRLTPQVIFVALLFILLPMWSANGGPHWYSMSGVYSENCSKNWWTSLFYLQAFYDTNEMCNFASWWISVDMLYHLFALLIILSILRWGQRALLAGCSLVVLSHASVLSVRHYSGGLPPNLLSSIPQTGAMWNKMTLDLFWTQFAHTVPFFMGLYLGHQLASQPQKIAGWLSFRRATFGWLMAISFLVGQSYSTYFWVIGRWQWTRLGSTMFHVTAPFVWATCLAWIIVACHFNYGGPINHFLSCKLFSILAKASYVVYLSHFIILFTFFGSQNLLIEPTQSVMSYVIIGNICLSMIFGSILCISFEMPWLKIQKRIMKHVN